MEVVGAYSQKKKKVGLCRAENLTQSLCVGQWRTVIFYGGQFTKCEFLEVGDSVRRLALSQLFANVVS